MRRMPVASSSSSAPSRAALPWLVIAGAALTIFSGPQWIARPWLAFVFKPLTIVVIIAYAWPRAGDSRRRRAWVLAGLALSLLGDIALLWPQQGFLPGLVAFLLAHLAYIVAFTASTRLAARWQPFAFYGVVAALILAQLWDGLPTPLRVPVLAYVLCLATMAGQSAAWWLQARKAPLQREARRAALRGLLFLCSDALLAFDKFMSPLPEAALWILGYILACAMVHCIALSPHRHKKEDRFPAVRP